tara:strand:- start:439 stop:579 length:141 start_codon:yes stop_codon:yes gene_type:complete
MESIVFTPRRKIPKQASVEIWEHSTHEKQLRITRKMFNTSNTRDDS